MKKLVITTVTVGVLSASALGLAGAVAAAPSGPGSAQDTLNSLQAQGYKVIANKVGNAPLGQCTVSAVRPGHNIMEPATGLQSSNLPVHIIRYTTVYLDVKC